MTLDFKKLIRNSVKKQMAIQHFECNVQIFKKNELPEQVMQKIQKTYGESFCEDANYTLWFSGNEITKEIAANTIFKIANKAMGEAANSMNESDLKMIRLDASENARIPDKTLDDVDSMTDRSSDKANADAVKNLVGNSDEGPNGLGESVEEPQPGEKFVFIKITMK